MKKLLARLAAVFVLLVLAIVSPITGNAAEPSYILPAVPGSQIHVKQGNGGKVSHHEAGQYAFDFTSIPSQFVVTAARSGRVIDVKNDSDTYCDAISCWLYANHILVDHGDGTSSLYMHLEKGSVLVNVGDQISQRQKLALVGLSGWTTGLHLHFQVQETPTARTQPGWWYTQSVPVKFSSPEVLEQSRSADGVPKEGQTFIVSGKKGEILPSAGATTRPSSPTPSPTVTKSPSGAPTPTPVPVPTPTKPVPTPSQSKTISPSTAPVPRPTPSKSTAPPAQPVSITIVRLWTQNSKGKDSSSFACSGSTNRVITYRISLQITATTTAHASLIESWGGQPLNENTTFLYGKNGQVEFFVLSDSPQGKAGTQSYKLIIDYDDSKKTVTAEGKLTTNC